MTIPLYDRVLETTSTTGTGPLTLLGTIPRYQSFAVVGSGRQTYYAIEPQNETVGQWEVGIGTYTAGGTLSRDTVLASSSGGAHVDLAGGIKNVFLPDPAARENAGPPTQMSVTADAAGLRLVGDSATPGGGKYYGTNVSGTPGYFALPAGGGNQTPWTSHIDGAGFNLANVGTVTASTLQAGVTGALNCALQALGLLLSGATGLARWRVRTGGPESTGNAGSDLQVQRFTDAGGILGTVLTLQRSTGFAGFGKTPAYAVDVQGDVNVTGGFLVNGVPIAGSGMTGTIGG